VRLRLDRPMLRTSVAHAPGDVQGSRQDDRSFITFRDHAGRTRC
jgi:hypothetical protein